MNNGKGFQHLSSCGLKGDTMILTTCQHVHNYSLTCLFGWKKKNLAHEYSVFSIFLPFCQKLLSKSLLSVFLQGPTTASEASTLGLHFLCEYITKENRKCLLVFCIFMPKCLLAFSTSFSCQNAQFNSFSIHRSLRGNLCYSNLS